MVNDSAAQQAKTASPLPPIVFPDIPDVPRSRGTSTVRARVEILPQPAPVNYGQPSVTSGHKYQGFVRDWKDQINFGRRIPGPHWIRLECRALDADHAHVLLNKQAKDKGFALGGVQHIGPAVKGQTKPDTGDDDADD